MNPPLAFRLPSSPGWVTALVVAMLWPGWCPLKGAQSSFGNTYTPVAGTPVEPPWPMVDWGIEPAPPGKEGLGWPVGKESIPGLGNAAETVALSIRSTKGDVVLNFGLNRDSGLGPVVSVIAPTSGEGEMTGANGTEAGPIRLGNVTFNQAANSFNVWGGVAKDAELSRQFQVEAVVPSVVQSSAISGWAIAALAAIALIIAMAISYYENDRDDRKRRRSSRKSGRRHRRTS